MIRRSLTLAAALLVALAGPATAATDAQKCESAVELASAKYAQCRLKAESKFTKTSDAPALATALGNCATKLQAKYASAFASYTGSCPTVEPESSFEAYLNQCTTEVEAAAAGGTFPACGDGAINVAGEQCDGSDLGGESCTSLGFVAGTLGCTGGCALDTSACATGSLCGNGTVDAPEQCDSTDLAGATCASLGYTLGGTLGCTAGCGYDTSGCASQRFPATGQTTCWNSAGAVISCAGTGHDGDVQAGATLAYVDNGDGTVTDVNTGLMWEKLSDDGSIHDKDTFYTWDNAFAVKVATLNSGSFAGYTDWRVPNRKELESILNLENVSPAVSPAFNTGCVAACTMLTCSCTGLSGFYWSSSAYAYFPQFAWFVDFSVGVVDTSGKSSTDCVRAVRAGS